MSKSREKVERSPAREKREATGNKVFCPVVLGPFPHLPEWESEEEARKRTRRAQISPISRSSLCLPPPFCNALREKREEEEELPFISGGEWRGEEAGEAEEKK